MPDYEWSKQQQLNNSIAANNTQYVEQVRNANSLALETAKQRQKQLTQQRFINNMYDDWKRWRQDMSQNQQEGQMLITDNAGNVLAPGEIMSPVRFKKQTPINYLSIYR